MHGPHMWLQNVHTENTQVLTSYPRRPYLEKNEIRKCKPKLDRTHFDRGPARNASPSPSQGGRVGKFWSSKTRYSRSWLRAKMAYRVVMRCAKGICAKGFGGCTRFSLLRWEKGSETPSCGGKRGLRLPRSLGRSMRNEGVSDPFFHRKRESQTLFPTAKGKTSYIPQNPLAQIPLAQRMTTLVKRRSCYKPQNPEKLKYGKSRSKIGFLEIRKLGQKVGKKG